MLYWSPWYTEPCYKGSLLYFHMITRFKFMDGYEMTHIASRGIEKVPYCFWGHPSNFNVTGDYIVGWHMIVLGYSVGCTSVAPFSTVLWAALTMRLFHHIYTLVCDGGSLEALTFSSIGPCTWLLFSALCTVWIDSVAIASAWWPGSCPPCWGTEPCVC